MRDHPDRRDRRELTVRKVLPEPTVHRGRRAPTVQMAHKDHKERLDRKAWRGLTVRMAPTARLERKVPKDSKEFKVHKDRPVPVLDG